MDHTTSNPYTVFEKALSAFAGSEICDQRLLFVVESQGRLVHSWVEDLQSVTAARFRSLQEHQNCCLQAYQTMLNGFRLAYQAINEKNRFKLNDARNLVREGQQTLDFAQAA